MNGVHEKEEIPRSNDEKYLRVTNSDVLKYRDASISAQVRFLKDLTEG